jgi:hypothetical protein
VRNLGRKAIIFGTAVTMVIVFAFFEVYVFRIKEQGTITVGEIMAYPSEWVNRTVIVEGNLSKSTDFDAFLFKSLWLYRLSSDGESIEVNASSNVMNWSLGMMSSNSSTSVAVYGVVEKLSDMIYANDSSPMRTIYYIAADRVLPLVTSTFCGCPNTPYP